MTSGFHGGDYEHGCLLALMMEAVQTTETSVNSYQSTRRYNPEDSHLQRYFIFYRIRRESDGDEKD
jgi:hypothetical protein